MYGTHPAKRRTSHCPKGPRVGQEVPGTAYIFPFMTLLFLYVLEVYCHHRLWLSSDFLKLKWSHQVNLRYLTHFPACLKEEAMVLVTVVAWLWWAGSWWESRRCGSPEGAVVPTYVPSVVLGQGTSLPQNHQTGPGDLRFLPTHTCQNFLIQKHKSLG